MVKLFEERERAAELGYVRAEEVRFVAHRRGIEALAEWTAQNLGLDGAAAVTYSGRIVAGFVHGSSEADILAQVQTDLERAGKPALSNAATAVLARATADATVALHGMPPGHGHHPQHS